MSDIRRDYTSAIRPPFFSYGQPVSGSAFASPAVPLGGPFLNSQQLGGIMSALQGLHSGWTGFLGAMPSLPTAVNPFWTNLLEGQNPASGMTTMKFPSDQEDGGGFPIGGGGIGSATQKYPSDSEDGGGGGFGGIGGGGVTTMKFPSDNEDGSGGFPIGGGGGISMTQKYPSDNEDGGQRFAVQ
jgi:hypothetical protein